MNLSVKDIVFQEGVTVFEEKSTVYFTPGEVVIHNKPSDCWVVIFSKVYNITDLVEKHIHSKTVRPLLIFAGKDISHWFDEETQDPKTCIHPMTGVRCPYLQHGYLPDISHGIEVPCSNWTKPVTKPWWRDERYIIGKLTKGVRQVKICNVLTGQVAILDVCAEDTFNRIAERLLPFNSKPHTYMWQLLDGTVVDMSKTLEENGLPDEREKLEQLDIPMKYSIPFIKLFFCENPEDFIDTSSDDSDDECRWKRRAESLMLRI